MAAAYGPDCYPLRRWAELTVLRTHPALWARYPDGDLAAMPARVLRELFAHAQAERAEMARMVGSEVAVALLKAGAPVRP